MARAQSRAYAKPPRFISIQTAACASIRRLCPKGPVCVHRASQVCVCAASVRDCSTAYSISGTSCVQCPANYYCPTGTVAATACPAHATSPAGSSAASACVCSAGYYGVFVFVSLSLFLALQFSACACCLTSCRQQARMAVHARNAPLISTARAEQQKPPAHRIAHLQWAAQQPLRACAWLDSMVRALFL